MTNALKNSANSPHSDTIIACAWLSILILFASAFFYRSGFLLYYGDAQAHLNISRSILDSRTPGYDQLGAVWLPVLHIICLPFAANSWLWTTGLAGTIPVAVCFVVAGVFLYLSAKAVYGSPLAGGVVAACFVLNPNVLYLASIPMTEIVFLAGLAALLFAEVRFAQTENKRYFALGIVSSLFMSLTRYDGWFLIPFVALWFAYSAKRRRLLPFLIFGALASLGPLFWLAHNYWETSNALDFANGPYSAKAIQGGKPYPGYHDWLAAIHYYAKAAQLCSGWMLLLLGLAGLACAVWTKTWLPLLLLALTPIFYVWSIHSSWTPIHVPEYWPHGYYNVRYGIAVVPLCAFAAGAIALAIPGRYRAFLMLAPIFAALPWVVKPSPENWICWKESQVNSVSRRAWTNAAASFLSRGYTPGQGVIAKFGDLAGIFCRAQIPLKDVLHEGNGPAWEATSVRPDLVHQQTWAIAQKDDLISKAMQQTHAYKLQEEIHVSGAPALEIYKRGDQK